ncbi:MAG: ribosomal RNA small subunit methyltransferase A [Thermoplasmata archaeon]|nr:ribosomal RNA small subunit methyltransferase A [Thermoplasmata archaeon]
MEPGEIKSILGGLGIKPSKRYSQNFLISEDIARKQVEAAGIESGDRVLEIGPGLGILTRYILERTDNAIFIEKDPHLAGYIEKKYKVDVICDDALAVEFPDVDIIVANLPYHISSEITLRILESGFKRAILMYQKEFADHLIAQPGSRDYSRITVAREFYADAEFIMKVPKSMYHPSPKVDSMIIKLSSREPPITPRDKDHFFKIIRLIFSHKKRTVRNALLSEAGILGISKPELRDKLEGLPHADERAFKLTLEELNDIVEFVYNIDI